MLAIYEQDISSVFTVEHELHAGFGKNDAEIV